MNLPSFFYKNNYVFIGYSLLFLLLSSCTKYVYFPTETEYQLVSPAYVLQIQNQTGSPIDIEPNGIGRQKGYESNALADGEIYDVVMQVRHFKIGSEDDIGGNQIISGPYIDQYGANTAVIRVRHSELYELTIDLESDEWFSSGNTNNATAPKLMINLKDFSKSRWFFNDFKGSN